MSGLWCYILCCVLHVYSIYFSKFVHQEIHINYLLICVSWRTKMEINTKNLRLECFSTTTLYVSPNVHFLTSAFALAIIINLFLRLLHFLFLFVLQCNQIQRIEISLCAREYQKESSRFGIDTTSNRKHTFFNQLIALLNVVIVNHFFLVHV